jgi:hypothetical protein
MRDRLSSCTYQSLIDNRLICLQTPLEKGSIDVAVFCLSLMGVDYPIFLKEAHRVLKLGYPHTQLNLSRNKDVVTNMCRP